MRARWSVVKLRNGLGEHALAWDALNRRKFNSHPMLDSRFVNGLLLHFGSEGEWLCVLKQSGSVEAMCLVRPDQFTTWATFLPSQAQIGPALVDSPAPLRQLMHDLPGLVARLDILCSDSAMGDLAGDPKRTVYTTEHALTMNISLLGRFVDYWDSRSKKLTQNIGRYERRVASAGLEARFRCHVQPHAVSAGFEGYAGLESSGWKAKKGTAISLDNAQGKFYGELMAAFAQTGNAMVFELWFGEQLAASRLAITSNDMVVMLKTTYSEQFARLSPGQLLLRRVVEHLFQECPGRVVEIYTNASVDQLAWSTGQREIRHISFYTDSLTERVFSFLRSVRNRFNSFSATQCLPTM